jgi:DnaJ-class molecular chaperone
MPEHPRGETAMAARNTTARRRRAKCPDCDGKGETTETVRVGARKRRETDDRQSALCLTCFGTGHAPDPTAP